MNDFAYEVREKKSLARSSRYKKGGSRSKKCTLPSDGLTQKQWKERNGEVAVYNLNKPMKIKEFQSMPPDLRSDYVKNIVGIYGATAAQFGEMFGVCRNTAYKYIKDYLPYKEGQPRMTRKQENLWASFLAGESVDKNGAETSAPPDELTTEPAENTDSPFFIGKLVARDDVKKVMNLEQIELVFSGEINYNSIVNSMRGILGDAAKGRLIITFQKEATQ